jgi:Tol biopolymer transport system component
MMRLAIGVVASGLALASPFAAAASPSGTTTLESVSTTGAQGNLYSYAAAISADGRYVVFNSDATNLVPHDTNQRTDAFVRDRRAGVTTRISVSTTGAQARATSDPFGGSHATAVSADGRYVVFRSDAPNLVRHDTNHAQDIFVRDRIGHTTRRVSISTAGVQADGRSDEPTISADGRYVAFSSTATNLARGDTNGASDIFVRDRATGVTRRVSLSSRGRQANAECSAPQLTRHGRYVVFASPASTLVSGDTNGLSDVFVRDRSTGTTRRVSVANSGVQASDSTTHTGSNAPAISAGGRYVVFHSDAANLVSADTNRVFDIFVRDRVLHTTRRVSVGVTGEQANAESLGPAVISGNGRYVAFASLADNLVAGDVNGITDVFIRDLSLRTTSIGSLASDGTQGNDGSAPAALSPDGRFLAFSSWAGNLVPNDGSPGPDVFVRDQNLR